MGHFWGLKNNGTAAFPLYSTPFSNNVVIDAISTIRSQEEWILDSGKIKDKLYNPPGHPRESVRATKKVVSLGGVWARVGAGAYGSAVWSVRATGREVWRVGTLVYGRLCVLPVGRCGGWAGWRVWVRCVCVCVAMQVSVSVSCV